MQCKKIVFYILLSYQSMIFGSNSVQSYLSTSHVYNMTAQIYGLGNSNLPDPVTVPHGGTGDTTLALYGVLVGQGVSPVQTVTGSAGTVLIGNTALNPSFSDDITVSNIDTTTGTITAAPVVGTDICQ